MSKHKKDPLIVALLEGCSYTWTVPDGGNLASMRAALKHGQTITMAPVRDPHEVQSGDMVLVKWHGSTIFHIVSEIQGDRFLIINSLGKVNGWVNGADILGRVTSVVDPEPRPPVSEMLEQLEGAYRTLIEKEQPGPDEERRLLSIVDDLRWYAGRIGVERWNSMPRENKWSFEQNLWQLTKQAKSAVAPTADRLHYFIDCGKKCVGMVGEILCLFEYPEPE